MDTYGMLVITSILMMIGIIVNVYQWGYRMEKDGEGGSNIFCLILLLLHYAVYLLYIFAPPHA